MFCQCDCIQAANINDITQCFVFLPMVFLPMEMLDQLVTGIASIRILANELFLCRLLLNQLCDASNQPNLPHLTDHQMHVSVHLYYEICVNKILLYIYVEILFYSQIAVKKECHAL